MQKLHQMLTVKTRFYPITGLIFLWWDFLLPSWQQKYVISLHSQQIIHAEINSLLNPHKT